MWKANQFKKVLKASLASALESVSDGHQVVSSLNTFFVLPFYFFSSRVWAGILKSWEKKVHFF